jgi:AraC-like DNA-binding protein
MQKEHSFFKDPNLPFVESRYSLYSSTCFKDHSHESFSIGAVEEGVVEFIYDKQKLSLSPNRLAIILPDILHSCNPEPNKSRSYHMVYIDTFWIYKNFDIEMTNVKIDNLLTSKPLFDEFIALSYFFTKEEFYLEKENRLINFLEKIFSSVEIEITKPKTLVSEIKSYLKKEIQSDLTLHDIASHFGYSSTYFIKLFKKYTNQTPSEYMLFKRIELAKKLLKKNLPLAFVAQECGFFDQSHFHKYFKQVVAATPKEYQGL